MSSEPTSAEQPGADQPKASKGEVVVEMIGLSKCYHIYARPQDRLKQFFARDDKRYCKEFWALRDITMDVRRGETLGIVGKNGAGKSTLLQLVSNTLKPTSGEVKLHGRLTALLELGSGFHQDFTGRENVYVAGALLGLEREQMNERMERIETFADIGEFIDRPVKTYSKGMFARLSFSVYANLDPEVFIVDEALAVGDARFRHKCMYRFKQMQDQGVAVIYVSHDAASMKHLCDRVAWINNGRLEQIGESTPVVDSYLYHLFYDAPPTPIPSKEKKPVRGDDAKGSLAGTFTHCELLDEDSHFIEHATGGQKCAVRLTFKNHHIAANDDKLIIGFVINSVQGLAITGANTIANDVAIERPRPGESVVVTFRFTMPPLVPGSYAVEVTGVNLDEKGTLHLLHMLPNAMMFQTSHPKQIFGLIGLDCEISVESDDA